MFSEEGLQQQCHSQTDKLQLVQSQVQDEKEEREKCFEALESTMEKLKSSEEVCEIAKQHVRQLQDDLEASELESAQAAMQLCLQHEVVWDKGCYAHHGGVICDN
eukprot:s1329_g12.t1